MIMESIRQNRSIEQRSVPVNHRALLQQLWQAGVDSVSGRQSVRAYLQNQSDDSGEYAVIAMGKAAADMMLGALDCLAERISSGLVLTKHHHLCDELDTYQQIQCYESSHPLPDQSSLDAGRHLLRYISSIPEDRNVIVLISGGASSLIEALQAPCTLDDLQALNEWALNSGLDIHEINYMRQRLSAIKGGKLRAYLPRKPLLCLYISDVPGDSVTVIGSGLLAQGVEDACELSSESRERIDTVLRQRLPDLPLVSVLDNDSYTGDQHRIIASNLVARKGVQGHAESLGFAARVVSEPLAGDYEQVAEAILTEASAAEPGLIVWGGEPTVQLPENPGKGGRNQALALLLALHIQGREDLVILVAGTDGTDGPTDAAGAIVDGNSYARAVAAGWQPRAELASANAYPCLQAMGDLMVTGPTGTNVMDLVIVMRIASP